GQIDDFAFLGGALGAVEIGKLMDGSLYETSPVGPLPANSIEAYAGGAMVLEDAATVKTLTGTGSRAEICLAGDLAVQGSGTADEQTTFAGRITGAGDFVKRGADYTLALTGANTYEGATRVAEGTLELAGPRRMRSLVGRWTFEDAARPGADASGNGFDLEGGNVTVVEDPERGRVASFNGAAALSSRNYPAAFPFGDEGYTVSLWLKGSPSGNGSAGVVAWGKLGVDHQCALWRLDPKVGWMMTNWNHNHNGDGTSFRDDAWHHVVWVCDEVQNSVYIDGGDPITWTRETAPSVVLDETTFYLGFNPFSGLHFTGLMDDVRVYKGALTDAEARAEHRGAVAQEQIFAEDFPKPVYEWSFEDAAAPGANTGTAEDGQLDVVGNARCSEVAGRPGKVLDLTGDTMSYLEAGTFPAACPRDATNWSVTFWERTLNLDDVDQTHDAMLYWGDPERQFLLFGFRSRNGTFRVTNMGFSDTYAHGFSLVPRSARAQWHHVAVTYHGTRLSIFIDGAPYASGDMTLQDVGDKYFWIGRKASSDTAWFRGYLDDVRIYDRALSAKMIRRMIRAEQAASILPETTAVEVAENAELVVSMADQCVKSLTGAGVVRVDAGAVLEVAESGVFEGTLELAALDRLSLPAGTTLRARTAVVDGARLKSGVYPCGAGVLRVGGDLGTAVIVR
ncbi:MAG: LamG-like jellyroll fold domain-containing protein, partial [Kiritimatiellia bacterium]